MGTKLETVNVCGDEILVVRDAKGEGYVVIQRMCEALGVDWNGQRQRLARSEWATTCVIHAVATDGKFREVFALHVKSFPMWLATMDSSRVGNPDSRDQIIRYQKEAADILYRWATGQPMVPDTREQAIARALLLSADVIKEKDAVIAEKDYQLALAAPKVAAHDALYSANGDLCLSDIGRSTNLPAHLVIEWMREAGYLHKGKESGGFTNKPMQWCIEQGLMEYDIFPNKVTGHLCKQTKVTPKGLLYFAGKREEIQTYLKKRATEKKIRKPVLGQLDLLS